MDEEIINQTAVDFTNDSHNQYGDFWSVYKKYIDNHLETIQGGKEKRNTDLRNTFVDPDMKSETLQHYHKKAWSSRLLPNGESMTLAEAKDDYENNVLLWKENEKEIKFCFASDVIFTSFIGYDWIPKCIELFEEVYRTFNGEQSYRAYIEGYTKIFYCNIGSFVIFPRTGDIKKKTINQVRGRGGLVDRFDLALECIRLYYKNKKDENKLTKQEKGFIERHKDLFTQLFEVIDKDSRKINQEFFDLFRDFKGYVDFFCFQDWVSDDYAHVKDLMRGGFLDDDGNISFEHPFPQCVEEYNRWMENQLEFVKARTQRINQAITEKN